MATGVSVTAFDIYVLTPQTVRAVISMLGTVGNGRDHTSAIHAAKAFVRAPRLGAASNAPVVRVFGS